MNEIKFSDLIDSNTNEEALDLPKLSVHHGASW